jgi:hypothetical protein
VSSPIVPDHIRAAIHAGHVGQVVIFCDRCGVQEVSDYTGETREVRFAAARRNLAENKGWRITDDLDLCPTCGSTQEDAGVPEVDWLDAFAGVRFKFWLCPVDGHSDSRTENGRPVVTVQWDGNVARCTFPGCGRTNQTPKE